MSIEFKKRDFDNETFKLNVLVTFLWIMITDVKRKGQRFNVIRSNIDNCSNPARCTRD